jgi:hypothetical protein
MQPTAGGVTYEAARNAVDYGYGPGTGARFLSMPTHHTKAVARREGRTGLYLEAAFGVNADGTVPDPVPAIMDLCAERDIVFDCGHVDGWEAVALVREAAKRGCKRIRTHCARYETGAIAEIVSMGGYAEFSFFLLTHATQVGLTHVDQEKHRAPSLTVQDLAPRIRAAGNRAITSSDAGIFLLAPPVEAFREFMVILESEGFTEEELKRMNADNPADLFRVGNFM